MIQLMKLPVQRGNAPLRVAKGHFVTNHSHINYYIDITYQKTRISEAKDSAYQLVASAINDSPIDTILCLDGTAVLGTCIAEELSKAGFSTLNAHKSFYVIERHRCQQPYCPVARKQEVLHRLRQPLVLR